MKKDSDNNAEDTLKPEYDFAQMQGGVRGKYVERYHQGTNLVLLDPDVAKAFPSAADVNQALRLLMKLALRSATPSTLREVADASTELKP